MSDWESKGIKPTCCTDPVRLSDYIEGKQSRDWHIKEWKLGVSEGLFLPEEFIGTLGLREKDFRPVFGRDPDWLKVRWLNYWKEKDGPIV